MILNKYMAGLLTLLGTLVYALQLSLADNVFTVQEQWEFAGLAAGALATIFVPLLPSGWAAGLKVSSGVAVAVIGSVIGVLVGGEGWQSSTTIAVIFAGINALMAQLGVSMRLDAVKQELADPSVRFGVSKAADKPAVEVAMSQGAVVKDFAAGTADSSGGNLPVS